MNSITQSAPLAWTACLALAVALFWVTPAPTLAQPPCEEFSNGPGSPPLPPDCEYHGDDFKELNDQATIDKLLALPIHQWFVCESGESHGGNKDDCRQSGGSLGGNEEQFTSEVVLELQGQGSLAGYNRTVVIPNVFVEVHSGPDIPGSPVQDFPTEMMVLQGSLPAGDPDFASLTIVGGTNNGYPSPGHFHAQYNEADDVWTIDSDFQVSYSIGFEGAPGGPLDGFSGTTDGTMRMVAYGHQ